MTDSPAFRSPIDPAEQPILDKILDIRDSLSLLKQDRSTYVKSKDVITLYNALINQVEKLNDIRTTKPEEQNRVDTVLDDCFQLISLFFLTIGRNYEAPAVYSAISSAKRLLDHLREAGFYSLKDLEGISRYLGQWQASIERDKDQHSPHLLKLLEARINVCRHTLQDLQEGVSKLEPTLADTYEKLVSLLRSLSACNTRSKFPTKEVKDLEAQLLAIREELHEETPDHQGKSAEEVYLEKIHAMNLADYEVPKEGPAVVSVLLARCLLWAEIIQRRQGKIDERFNDTYDKLVKIRNTLEQMNLTHAWIDESRVKGNFVDEQGNVADLHTNRTLLYLLRKSYSFVFIYIISSEPVSEALLPIYNQLLTLKKCLVEVKRNGGVDSARELYPYSMKLHSIDNMKKDGAFRVGNDIPEGQGSVIALLSECFDLAYELRNEAEERSEAEVPEERDEAQPVGTKTDHGLAAGI
ncbi:hypothetical protein AMS68_003755 [Peltaster fructicola]|uniref:Uncharacterized protein n=1 Tax=Peltaster fructicola TaxID=286661 RepID=A0A6H0XUE4_9PEZI|nr:hypothetical protein AMS68_003755 [Peltaster fructicola]